MLFKTIDEIKEIITLNATTTLTTLTPHIKRAEQKYIKFYLGKELYDKLHEYYNTEEAEEDETLDILLKHVQLPLALFAYKDAIPQLNVIATNSGFAVTQNNNVVPASKQRTDELQASQEEAAWDGIEILLEFLEENKDDYPEWSDSTAYTLANRNFINSANEFSKYADINISRLAFMKLRTIMDNVENIDIANVISPEMVADIKLELRSGELSEANEAIFENLKKALANLALSQKIVPPDKDSTNIYAVFNVNDEIRKQYARIGTDYLSKAADVIKATPDDYPAYEESAIYAASLDADLAPFENEEDSGIAVFGAGG